MTEQWEKMNEYCWRHREEDAHVFYRPDSETWGLLRRGTIVAMEYDSAEAAMDDYL